MTHAAQPHAAPAQSRAEELMEIVWEGIVAGLIGYATVAIFIGFIDVAQGRSFFFTAAMLGEAAFYGLTDPAHVVVWPGAVFAYNGVHLLGFLFIGMSAVWLAYLAEKGAELWYFGLVLFLLVVAHACGAVLILTEGLRAALPVWVVIVPTVVGLAAMTAYVLGMRPGLRAELTTWRN
jgi:hypothetical protein